MTPSAREGRGRKRIERWPGPVPTTLAMALKQADAGRPGEASRVASPAGLRSNHHFSKDVVRCDADNGGVTLAAHSQQTRDTGIGLYVIIPQGIPGSQPSTKPG
jgi:hypothetical protein